MLERTALLAAMDRMLAATGPGGRVVLVAGEAGIGKSALVRGFLRRHEKSVSVLIGLCDPVRTPRVSGPLRDIVRQIDPLAVEKGREQIFAALQCALLRHDGQKVLVVEDAQWADEVTTDVLIMMGRRVECLPVLLILTYRDDELAAVHPLHGVLGSLPSERVLRLQPEPLSEKAVAELTRLSGRTDTGVHAVTGGNPLLVNEVLAAEQPGVPAAVHDLVLARLAGLPPAARQVVRFVSVIPTRTTLETLTRALRPPVTAVEACFLGGLVLPDGEAVRFRHELFRQAVERSLSVVRYRHLHRLALRVRSQEPGVDAAQLAYHAEQAGDGAAALRYARQAAVAAESSGAYQRALDHYRTVLRYADRVPASQRAELLERCSLNAYLIGNVDEACGMRVTALQLRRAAGEVSRAGEDLRWLSRLHWWAGRREEAEDAARRAITELEPGGASKELAMAYSTQAQLDVLAHELPSAIDWSTRAISVAEQVGDEETLAHALTSVGSARQGLGDSAGRVELERAVDIAVRRNFPHHAARALTNLAITTMQLGEVTRALRDWERARAFARGHDLHTYELYLLGHRAWWRLNLGDWTGAEHDARDALGQSARRSISVAPALMALGRLQSRRGHTDAADTLREAARLVSDMGEPQRVAPVVAARIEHAWLCGQPERALTEATRGFELALRTRHPWFAGELAWWLHRAGQEPAVPAWIAEPYRLLLAGRWDSAAKEWERRGRPYEQAEALACGDHDAAHRQALEIFDRLSAIPAATQLRRQLREQGRRVPRGPRAATAANPARLTKRQMEVLAHLSTGVSNAEIARQLCLSVRTVDHHVAAVMAKLSVHSREQAIEAARRLGILAAQDR
ncbi:ATP-binding protein [Amycolatopsis sp. cmx-4-68]|uniref:ATP-binding protein n=1 Tax=Amycolatopsis sp. cmx-4-68 TaxID=2790938 RepID=UPI0039789F8B